MKAYLAALAIVLCCCLAFPASGPAAEPPSPAVGAPMDESFARRLIRDFEANFGSVRQRLATLEEGELRQLRETIQKLLDHAFEDDDSLYGMEWRYARWLANHIDDRLGCLRYDLTADGRFFMMFSGGAPVTYYLFRLNNETVVTVGIDDATLQPEATTADRKMTLPAWNWINDTFFLTGPDPAAPDNDASVFSAGVPAGQVRLFLVTQDSSRHTYYAVKLTRLDENDNETP